MAFKFTKADTATLTKFREEIGTKAEAVNDAIRDLNELLEQLRNWKEEKTEALREAFSEKSDKWQEGEKGEAVNNWIETIENLDADEIEEFDIEGLITALEELPNEPE